MEKAGKIKIEKWKPKKFVKSFKIDMKTGKTTPLEIIIPKTREEQEKIENDATELWLDCMEKLWGDKFDWFMRSADYLIKKHGEKEFSRLWNKEMKKNENKIKEN